MKKLSLVFSLAILMVFNSAVSGQKPKKYPPQHPPPITFEQLRAIILDLRKKADAARQRGNELTELDTLRALEAGYASKGLAAHQAIATLLLTVNPLVGNYREALRYADVGHEKPPPVSPVDYRKLDGYRSVSAVDAIALAADKTQVIMINEAHHVPQHRAFTIALLKRLWQQGFKYFAAEDLKATDTRLNERGYPNRETGYYIAEPVYGDLIRTAITLGYRVVPYEPPFQDAEQRERDQAQNLVDRILKKDPRAKILVHAGYAHIDETGMRTGAITMAQRFKELTGIDPLTVDQTEMTERSEPDHEQPLYRYATGRRFLSQPTVFQTARGEFWTLEKGRCDITLFHPRSRYVNGRPTWLGMGGARRAYRLPKDICGRNSRCLVRARIAGESSGAIPIDQVEYEKGGQISALFLPTGRFVIDVQDPEGKPVKSFSIVRP